MMYRSCRGAACVFSPFWPSCAQEPSENVTYVSPFKKKRDSVVASSKQGSDPNMFSLKVFSPRISSVVAIAGLLSASCFTTAEADSLPTFSSENPPSVSTHANVPGTPALRDGTYTLAGESTQNNIHNVFKSSVTVSNAGTHVRAIVVHIQRNGNAEIEEKLTQKLNTGQLAYL